MLLRTSFEVLLSEKKNNAQYVAKDSTIENKEWLVLTYQIEGFKKVGKRWIPTSEVDTMKCEILDFDFVDGVKYDFLVEFVPYISNSGSASISPKVVYIFGESDASKK